jgi:hypothetical protein
VQGRINLEDVAERQGQVQMRECQVRSVEDEERASQEESARRQSTQPSTLVVVAESVESWRVADEVLTCAYLAGQQRAKQYVGSDDEGTESTFLGTTEKRKREVLSWQSNVRQEESAIE